MRAVVLGTGIIGLTSAVRLLEAGHQVRVVAAGTVEATTSWLAAAVWFPTHAGPPQRVQQWGATTFAVLSEQAERGVPGVYLRDSLSLYREDPGPLDWTRSVRELRTATEDELPPGYGFGLRYVVPLVEMPRYLPWLVSEVDRLGGQQQRQTLRRLSELGAADVIVNCSGLGARELVGDQSVYPVRGQVVRVTNPGLRVSVRDEHHPAGRAYVHPRTTDVILGGTLDEDAWDTSIDPHTADSILARCTEIVPALRGATVLEHLVGLRPGRPAVRLERAVTDGTRVVHNYGHGGSGVTLGWGCAAEVVELVGPSGYKSAG